MSTPSGIIVMGDSEWMAENARRLDQSTQRLIEVLASHLAGNEATFDGEHDIPPALEQLAIRFGLTPFERDLLLLCVACERSTELAELIGRCRGNPQESHVDFDVAQLLLNAPDRLALSPASALRRWRLLDLNNTRGWSQSRLVPDERVQFFLAGYSFLDSRLEGLIRPMRSPAIPEETLSARIAQGLRAATVPALCPIVQLNGGGTAERRRSVRNDLRATPTPRIQARRLGYSRSSRRTRSARETVGTRSRASERRAAHLRRGPDRRARFTPAQFHSRTRSAGLRLRVSALRCLRSA